MRVVKRGGCTKTPEEVKTKKHNVGTYRTALLGACRLRGDLFFGEPRPNIERRRSRGGEQRGQRSEERETYRCREVKDATRVVTGLDITGPTEM